MQPGEQSSSQIPSAPAAPVPAQPLAQYAQASTPQLADDGDLIEKEWVQQAKQIVQATANDPYEQNAQFTQLRAHYLQKRYGKQVKMDS